MVAHGTHAQHGMRMQRHSGAHHRLRTHPASVLQRNFTYHQVESRLLVVVVTILQQKLLADGLCQQKTFTTYSKNHSLCKSHHC